MSIPFSNVLFGRIIDALNKDPGNEDAFRQGINVVCVAFAVLGGINLITGFTQVPYTLPHLTRYLLILSSTYTLLHFILLYITLLNFIMVLS